MPSLKPLVALAIAAIAAPCAPAQPSGVAQPMLSIPGDPYGIFRSLVDIDLDNDGDIDLAAAFLDYGSPAGGDEVPTMWTFLNNGDGSFTSTQIATMPLGARQMRAADLNNDGIPDVIAGCVSAERMAIFLGDGNGGLTPGPVLDTQGQPNNFDLSDLDNDGDLDLAVAIQSTGLVSRIFTNDGNANFTLAATQSTAPFICDSVVLYDIDRDGDDDWGLLRGTGGGPDGFPGSILFYENLGKDFGEWAGFGAAPIASAGVGNTPFDVTEGDLDAVNGTDLVVANAFGSSITILLNDGAAGFLPPITVNLLPGLRRVHLFFFYY